ncbi:RidA family protein [Microbacterium sp. SSM24]|uniref:RidA family protein n=1 Tax=Microbacterium sp. SSM24 TaxID=2991714 RepID=UPI002227BA5E|nr:RidA family protein [Microbacterium sp. SSM24]MCW3492605.1 RidA family protein [Microbacterium sp. SSM24]
MPQLVNPRELAPPVGFAHGVFADNVVYLGGQTALNAEGRIVDGDIVAQFRRALENVLTTLTAAGGVPTDLVSLTIYLTDIDEYQRRGRDIGAVWKELVGAWYPAMAGIGVTQLWQREAVVEIQGIAVVTRP